MPEFDQPCTHPADRNMGRSEAKSDKVEICVGHCGSCGARTVLVLEEGRGTIKHRTFWYQYRGTPVKAKDQAKHLGRD